MSFEIAARSSKKWSPQELNNVVSKFIEITSTMEKDDTDFLPFFERLQTECYNILADNCQRTVKAIEYKLITIVGKILDNNSIVIKSVPLHKELCKAYNKFYTNEEIFNEVKKIEDESKKNNEFKKQTVASTKKESASQNANQHIDQVTNQELYDLLILLRKEQQAMSRKIDLIFKAAAQDDEQTTNNIEQEQVSFDTKTTKPDVHTLEVQDSDSDEEIIETQQGKKVEPEEPKEEKKKRTVTKKTVSTIETDDDKSTKPPSSTRVKRTIIPK